MHWCRSLFRSISKKNDSRRTTARSRPWGLSWRCSTWFVTLVVGFGITTDLLVYSIIVPIIPFQLEHLGYSGVSGLVGWLLFAYSGGLVIFTPPIALFSEHYKSRKSPLIAGLIALVGAQIMLMEAPKYWIMVLARILQGMSSSVVWVVGLALLCDTVPEAIVGRQLGLAMSGLSLGFLIGPPVSGALYGAFGFRSPFIFGIIMTMVDLLCRLMIIERKDAALWIVDHASILEENNDVPRDVAKHAQRPAPPGIEKYTKTPASDVANVSSILSPAEEPRHTADTLDAPETTERPSLLVALVTLCKSSRALSVCLCTLIYGIIYTSQEPALPLYLQARWNFNASKVGLVYIAAVVPTVFSSPLTGWLSDCIGTSWVSVLSLAFALPWIILLIVHGPLAFFIVVYALMNFFASGIVSPLTAELAAVTRGLDGVGYAHVYGAFNLAYGIGSALGPLIGGQIYEHVKRGWTAICLLAAGLAVASMALTFCYFENVSLLSRLMGCVKHRRW